MKKLSLLVALMLVITIGGVYAAWNYSQGSVDSEIAYLDAQTSITNKVVDNAKGEIAIDTSGISIVIDDSNNDHIGELTLSGSIKVSFTPADGADHNVIQYGIPLELIVSCSDNWNYNGNPIFTINSTPLSLNDGNPVNGEIIIPASELSSYITLNNLELHSASEYDVFRAALHNGSLAITVQEATSSNP